MRVRPLDPRDRAEWRRLHAGYDLRDVCTDTDGRGRDAGRAREGAHDTAGMPAACWVTQEFSHLCHMLHDQVAVRRPFIRCHRPL